ncbi:hypothetical protein PRZ48_003520 [Zasmidium cellare]|uniref:Uncharacterized protein n=1 Tax=Zasmidium cellare TaxID=395010 RepID=A0ABR0EVC8_ZASCE|nr:hypothetical protein PRZ48_003520 [Zasmidium cellare]
MALASASAQHFAAHDKTPRTAADPFWQSTPRTNLAGLASLMSAIQQVLPAPSTSANNTPQRKTTKHAMLRRPQCTHIAMKRLHGSLTCNMCNRVPELGWVYSCEQDRLPGQYDPLPDVDAVPITIPDESDYFDASARIAEYLQMSPSIIKSIRAGDYDIDQVEKLIKQREKVIRTINDQEARLKESSGSDSATSPPQNIIASVGSTAPAPHSSRGPLPMSPAGTPANTPHDSQATTPVKGQGQDTSRFKYNCTFQVCHACRQFFQDRMYASFESVLNGEMPSPTAEDWRSLPVANARIVSNIGQRPVPRPLPLPNIARPQPSMDIVTQSTSEDDISVDWSDSDNPSERLDSSELFPCPGAGNCPVWSRYSGCAYDTGFDDGRRAMNHGFLEEMDIDRLTPENSHSQLRHFTGSLTNTPIGTSSTASSLSLPTPTTSNLAPLLPTDDMLSVIPQKHGGSGKARSVCGEFDAYDRKVGLRGKPSSSSLGSEVEVEGGVALTEEAVESGTPDIITSQ